MCFSNILIIYRDKGREKVQIQFTQTLLNMLENRYIRILNTLQYIKHLLNIASSYFSVTKSLNSLNKLHLPITRSKMVK